MIPKNFNKYNSTEWREIMIEFQWEILEIQNSLRNLSFFKGMEIEN
jgi:hypothetical protein